MSATKKVLTTLKTGKGKFHQIVQKILKKYLSVPILMTQAKELFRKKKERQKEKLFICGILKPV
jgi:hypothetical protein